MRMWQSWTFENFGVLPKVTSASSGASMAGGDDIALLDSFPPTPPETPSPAVAKAAETSLGTSQGSASAAAVQALPMQQCSPAANAARSLQQEAEDQGREEIDAEDLVKAEQEFRLRRVPKAQPRTYAARGTP